MISKFKYVFMILGAAPFALAACGGATPVATHAIVETETLIASATATIATIEPATPTSTEAIVVDTSGVSYANDVLPILQSRCGSCHGTNNPREGLVVTTYVGILAGSKNGLIVIPGDPDNSILIRQIRDGEMPKRGPKLTPEQLQVLIEWILQGALDN